MGKYQRAIAEHDMFGHTINLNFNKEGDSHKTFIGGCFSVLIKVAMFTYVFSNLKKMILMEDDSNSIEYNLIDLDSEPETHYHDTDFNMFHILRKQFTGEQIYLNNETVLKNLDIFFVQQKLDYYEYPSESHDKETRIPAR